MSRYRRSSGGVFGAICMLALVMAALPALPALAVIAVPAAGLFVLFSFLCILAGINPFWRR